MYQTVARLGSCLLVSSVLVLVLAAPAAAVHGWSGPTRVLAENYPLSPSVVLKRGVTHVAYLHSRPFGSTDPTDTDGIFYASNAGGVWHRERVTTGDDFYARPSLAIDDEGHASIAFARACLCTPFTASIYIASDRSGSWRLSQRTHDAIDVAPSLRFAGGALHLAFARQGVGIIYQSKQTGSWVTSIVSSAATGACHIDQFPALAIDSAGSAWIAYEQPRRSGCAGGGSSSNGIRVATDRTGPWTRQVITRSREAYIPDVAIGPSDMPQVIYHDATDAGIHHSRRTASGSWTTPALVAFGNDASLAVDDAGVAHVAFEGSGPAYATNRSGTWATTPLASYGLDFGTASPVRVVLTNTGRARVLFARSESDGTEASLGLYLAREQ